MKRAQRPRIGEVTQYSWSSDDEGHYLDLDGDSDIYHIYASVRLVMSRSGVYSVKEVRICVILNDDYDCPYAEFRMEYGREFGSHTPTLGRDGLQMWITNFSWKEIWAQMQPSLEHVTSVHRVVGAECKRALTKLAESLRTLPS